MKANLTPKTFYILTGTVFVACAALMWFKNADISAQNAKIATLKKELRDEKEVQKELETSKKAVDDLKFKLVHLESGVQSFAYIPTMLKELEQFGKKNQIDITQVKPIVSPPSTGKGKDGERKTAYQELNVNVHGRGSYEDAMRFLRAIRVFPKIVAVRTVSLAPKVENTPKTSSKPVLELDLEIRAYAFKEESKDTKETKTASVRSKGANDES